MDLVIHQVLQSLVERRAHEHATLHSPSRVPVVHHLVPSLLIALMVQLRRYVLHRHVAERRAVALARLDGRHLAQQTLDQLPDGHTRRDGVRVHDDVRHDALARERHVLLTVRHTDRTLLTVARRQLVADLRNAHRTHLHLHEAVPLVVGGQHHLVHRAALRVSQARAAVLQTCAALRVHLARRRHLADQNGIARHCRTLHDVSPARPHHHLPAAPSRPRPGARTVRCPCP